MENTDSASTTTKTQTATTGVYSFLNNPSNKLTEFLRIESTKIKSDFDYHLNDKYFLIAKPIIGSLWIELTKKNGGNTPA